MSLMFMLAMAADSTLFWSDKQWSVYKNDDDCALLAAYNDDAATLWISYNYVLANATFIITDKSFKSVTGEKEYKLQLVFRKGSGLDRGWGSVDAKGIVIGKDDRGLQFNLKSDDALADVSSSSTLALLRDDLVVEALSLEGSTAAVAKLKACALQVYKINPSDPLEGAEAKK